MKALKDCKWTVTIDGNVIDEYYWLANSRDSGLFIDKYDSTIGMLNQKGTCRTRKGAINNWKRFAELNGIENYTVEGNGE